jgi:hypothetical protein
MRRGQSLQTISASIDVPLFTLLYWRSNQRRQTTCPRCGDPPELPEPASEYAYLLGLYLGDGCISVAGGRPDKGVWLLRIACADAWPGLLIECQAAVSAIRPDNKVGTVQSVGCAYVTSYSKHWPCLFPQHGPGEKHKRKIELAPWQQLIASQHPDRLVRGLFHSDGCRFINRVRRPLADGDHWYEYPRYMFTNESKDILGICAETLDMLGVDWRYSRRNTISVARRDAVARLDEFVGPKY